ncbi:MAG: VWA domain-containing protein, partial [Burkholderiales bacterium]
MAMMDWHFMRPLWLLALPLWPLLLWLLWRSQGSLSDWLRVMDRALLHALQSGGAARPARLPFVLALLAGVLVILGLAGPALERIQQPQFREDSAVVYVLDLSASMNSVDVAPSRLSQAKAALHYLIEHQLAPQGALVVFANTAYTVVPLSMDRKNMLNLLPALEPDLMPSQGSRLAPALEQVSALLHGVGQAQIVVLADGGADEAAQKAVDTLAAGGFAVSVVAVGGHGSPIPRDSGVLRDAGGKVVIAPLEETLADLVRGGRYLHLQGDEAEIQVLVDDQSHMLQVAAKQEAVRSGDQWRDMAPMLTWPALALVLLLFRRGWVLVLLIAIVPHQPVYAFDWPALWSGADQRGQRLLEQGAFDEAAQVFESAGWKAVALYRGGHYAEAAALWAEQPGFEARYNQATALARAGQLDEAIRLYEEVLLLAPDLKPAQDNKALLEQAREQARAEAEARSQKAAKKSEKSGRAKSDLKGGVGGIAIGEQFGDGPLPEEDPELKEGERVRARVS